ncbi:MAG: helix-turn-helix domain-containing protein [Chitinophagaceae bacterium]
MNLSRIDIKDKSQPNADFTITPFKKGIRKTQPHKHNNYFEIIYLSGGVGFHTIDSRKFAISVPIIFFIRREQIHFFDLEGEPEGFVAIIKKGFIQKSLDNELKRLLEKLNNQNCLFLKDDSIIQPVFQLLAQEYTINNEHSFHVIEGLLKALLAKILDLALPTASLSEMKSDLYQSFLELLQGDSVVRNSVQYYAGQLNTSPQNLNAACRKASDQSASGVLAEFITREAKRLLIYTSRTISQIAFALGFVDASHFVKYFKRITGQTPQVFRLSGE